MQARDDPRQTRPRQNEAGEAVGTGAAHDPGGARGRCESDAQQSSEFLRLAAYYFVDSTKHLIPLAQSQRLDPDFCVLRDRLETVCLARAAARVFLTNCERDRFFFARVAAACAGLSLDHAARGK
jgi:hypothetical protein